MSCFSELSFNQLHIQFASLGNSLLILGGTDSNKQFQLPVTSILDPPGQTQHHGNPAWKEQVILLGAFVDCNV